MAEEETIHSSKPFDYSKRRQETSETSSPQRGPGQLSYPIGFIKYSNADFPFVCRCCGNEVLYLIKVNLGDWRCQECNRKFKEDIRDLSGDPNWGEPQGKTALNMHRELISPDAEEFLSEVPIKSL